MDFGTTFALIGRNPKCGCPLAIDMEASPDAQQDFMDKGLLLEIVPEAMAADIWENAKWPCIHSTGVKSLVSREGEGNKYIVPESNLDNNVISFTRGVLP